ncbi:MAG: hypothetical protein ACPG6V_12295 [Flavobacteriales bacterium]
MKNIPLLTVLMILISNTKVYSQIGIGTTTPHASSILEVNSTSKGFLPPRLTSVNRDNINNPAEGLMIYNTDLSCIEYFTGSYWFNPCCSKTVNSGLDALPLEIFFNLDDLSQIEKINSTTGLGEGVTPQHNEFVYSYNSLVNGNTRALEFSAGALENNEVFQFKDETAPNLAPYKTNRSIYRSVNRNLIGYNGPIAVASMQYDFTPDYTGEFEIFLIAKIDSASDNIVPYSSFFSSADGTVNNSLQLGLGSPTFNTDVISGIPCETNYFRLFYKNGSSNRSICGTSLDKRVAVNDNQFHVFNIIQRNHPNGVNFVLELNIDGELVAIDEGLTEAIKFEKLKLFSNRKGDKAMKSYMTDLLFFSTPLSKNNNDKLNEYLVCKYGR